MAHFNSIAQVATTDNALITNTDKSSISLTGGGTNSILQTAGRKRDHHQ